MGEGDYVKSANFSGSNLLKFRLEKSFVTEEHLRYNRALGVTIGIKNSSSSCKGQANKR